MNNVTNIKQKLLDRMATLEYDKMNLADLMMCVNMLRSLADMPEKSYMDTLSDMLKATATSKPESNLAQGIGCAIGSMGLSGGV